MNYLPHYQMKKKKLIKSDKTLDELEKHYEAALIAELKKRISEDK